MPHKHLKAQTTELAPISSNVTGIISSTKDHKVQKINIIVLTHSSKSHIKLRANPERKNLNGVQMRQIFKRGCTQAYYADCLFPHESSKALESD